MPSRWQQAADVATTLGLPIAAVAALAAFASYWFGKRAAGDAHMHALFREYLIARLQHDQSNSLVPRERQRSTSVKGVEGQLAGLKLYALEAMWDWVRRNDHCWLRKLGFDRIGPLKARLDVIDAWRSTIIVHLNQDCREVRRSIWEYPDCYSLSFLGFVRDQSRVGRRVVQAALAKREAIKAERGPIRRIQR